MSTVIRPEVSKKNPYYISKERYYELKHFCLQYHDYAHRIALQRNESHFKPFSDISRRSTQLSDKTGSIAVENALYGGYMKMIEDCCNDAGGDISKWLFKSVTEGKSFTVLDPPCCKEYFYIRYRKFFYLLDKVR